MQCVLSRICVLHRGYSPRLCHQKTIIFESNPKYPVQFRVHHVGSMNLDSGVNTAFTTRKMAGNSVTGSLAE